MDGGLDAPECVEFDIHELSRPSGMRASVEPRVGVDDEGREWWGGARGVRMVWLVRVGVRVGASGSDGSGPLAARCRAARLVRG